MMNEKGRIRWQCRRALLELDLVFAPFLKHEFDQLNESQLNTLDELLQCEDHDLWAMINGHLPCPKEGWQEIIQRLQRQKTVLE